MGAVPSSLLRFGQEVQHITDSSIAADRVAQWKILLYVVPVAATFLLLDHVSGFGEVRHDAVGSALGYFEHHSEVPKTSAGIMGDKQQGPSVVREKAPIGHCLIIVDKYWK